MPIERLNNSLADVSSGPQVRRRLCALSHDKGPAALRRLHTIVIATLGGPDLASPYLA